jgi:hypothetical protein
MPAIIRYHLRGDEEVILCKIGWAQKSHKYGGQYHHPEQFEGWSG